MSKLAQLRPTIVQTAAEYVEITLENAPVGRGRIYFFMNDEIHNKENCNGYLK